MMRYKAILLLAILFPALGSAQKKKHNDLPAVFETAHSIYVEAGDGDYSKPGLFPADRKAIEDVQDAVQAWHRYTLAAHREQADLVVVVRKARAGNPDSQPGLSTSPRAPNGQTPVRVPGQPGDSDSMATIQMGTDDDKLQVYTVNPEGKLKGPIWTREIEHGLDGPSVMLFQQLRSAVEHAYPTPPPAANPTP